MRFSCSWILKVLGGLLVKGVKGQGKGKRREEHRSGEKGIEGKRGKASPLPQFIFLAAPLCIAIVAPCAVCLRSTANFFQQLNILYGKSVQTFSWLVMSLTRPKFKRSPLLQTLVVGEKRVTWVKARSQLGKTCVRCRRLALNFPPSIRVFNRHEFSGRRDFQSKKNGSHAATKSGSHAVDLQDKKPSCR